MDVIINNYSAEVVIICYVFMIIWIISKQGVSGLSFLNLQASRIEVLRN